MTDDDRYLFDWLATECEAAARFIRYYSSNPEALRDWAARTEDMQRNGCAGENLPASALENAAREARAHTANRSLS